MLCGLSAFSCHFYLHEQVDGTVSFSNFKCFSSLEALQGVHRAKEEHKEIRRNFSVRNTMDLIYRNSSDARSAREIEV
jgi:hypothetical protein